MSKLLQYIIIIWILLLFLSGCANNNTEDSLNTSITNQSQLEEQIPTPKEGAGVIYGVLTTTNGTPVTDGVFLSRNLAYNKPDLPPTISFSYQNSPRAFVDPETGAFYFSVVEPAPNYVISVMAGPSDLTTILDPDTELPLLISVQPGKSIDLGQLFVDLP